MTVQIDSKAQGHERTPGGRVAPRLLVIAPQPFFMTRGTPLNVRALVRALVEEGYRPDLLVYPLGEKISIPGVRIYRSLRLPGVKSVPIGPSATKILLDVFLFFTALRLVVFHRYAALHGVEEGGFMAAVLAWISGVPFVYDMDSCMVRQLCDKRMLPFSWLRRFARASEATLIRRADAVLTVCRALTEKAAEFTTIDRIFQAEDFPVEGSSAPRMQLLESLREQYALSEEVKVIVYTGNFETYQGVELLLQSIALLKKEHHIGPFKLFLVGGGKKGERCFDNVSRLVRSLNVEENVVFTGTRPADEMGTYMALADVLVSPRMQGDNTPLKIYSYMASGRPIVATAIGTHTQVLSSETAFLSDITADSFAAQLARALDTSPFGAMRVRKVTENSARLIETRYNYNEFRSQVGRMYAQVLGRKQLAVLTSLPGRVLSGENAGVSGE
ncbi:MAG: glycosyltransferase [bacterium]|nr:glycosyltransferase [bacterium]